MHTISKPIWIMLLVAVIGIIIAHTLAKSLGLDGDTVDWRIVGVMGATIAVIVGVIYS